MAALPAQSEDFRGRGFSSRVPNLILESCHISPVLPAFPCFFDFSLLPLDISLCGPGRPSCIDRSPAPQRDDL